MCFSLKSLHSQELNTFVQQMNSDVPEMEATVKLSVFLKVAPRQQFNHRL